MSAASNDRRGRWIARVVCGVLLCGGAACATQAGPASDAGPDVAVLSDVRVEQQGEMTVVTLQGVGDPLYAAAEESRRLVVDLSGVRPRGVPEEISLVDGVVEQVSVVPMLDAAGAPMTRIELAFQSEVEYDVAPEGADLAIRVIPREPLARAIEEPAPASDQPEPIAALPPVSAAPAPQATALTGVRAEDEGRRIHLLADGHLVAAQTFTLEKPPRLVIDLDGVESRLAAAEVPVASPHVTRVRVGQHPDKLRIVLDGAGQEDFGAYRVSQADDGLVVELGAVSAGPPPDDEQPAAAAEPASTQPAPPVAELEHPAVETRQTGPEAPAAQAAADAPAAAPAAAQPGRTRVTQVDFQADAGSGRVVIATEGPASYQLFEPDPQTVVVSMLDASLAPEAEARIAPEPGGPVSLVMAFEQPETGRPEVRVVISRGAGLRPLVTREDGNVVVAFDVHGAAAATPPALQDAGSSAAGASAKAVAQATAPGQPPAAVEREAGLEVLQEGGLLDGKEYSGRRISLDFKDVEVDDVLRLVAEVSDLNIIAGDEVSGKVTIRLVDVPWDQALDVILLTKGLGFVKVGNVLRIAPQTLLQQETESRLQDRRAKEKLEDLVVKFQPVNYAAVANVAKMVQRLLSPRGTVNTDARTNTIIIKDIPTVIDESVALIKAIDTPTPQVLIEAKIVEANLDFTRELGTVWGYGLQPYTDAFDTGSDIDQNRGTPDFRPHPDPRLLSGAGDLNNLVVDNPISALPTALMNVGAFLLDDTFNVELQLQAAESTGEGKVISSPRVVTLDNREAEIEQGVAIPYQTFENGDAQLQFVDAVLSLKVKPHITADRSIIMALEVSRNAPDDSVATGSVGAPAIGKNEAKTETLVRDGQTLVIGGIYTIQKSDRQSRVPYLHAIPLLGWLFQNTSVRDIRKELLIFVTPRIVDMPQLGT